MTIHTYFLTLGMVIIFSLIVAACILGYLVTDYKDRIKTDISAEEMLQLEKELAVFLNENNLRENSSIWDIAKVLNVRVEQDSLDTKERAKVTGPDENGYMHVSHSFRVPKNERLFDLAHECGHIIKGDQIPAGRPAGYDKPQEEQLADYLAAAMLMPRNEVGQYLQENNYLHSDSKKRVAVIKGLCKRYGVSEIIALRRVKEVYILQNMDC